LAWRWVDFVMVWYRDDLIYKWIGMEMFSFGNGLAYSGFALNMVLCVRYFNVEMV
jgi:hypothetical protein